jgi:hypothetical protein
MRYFHGHPPYSRRFFLADVGVLESVLQGDSRCRFAIHLP